MSYLYSKLPETGVPSLIGTGGLHKTFDRRVPSASHVSGVRRGLAATKAEEERKVKEAEQQQLAAAKAEEERKAKEVEQRIGTRYDVNRSQLHDGTYTSSLVDVPSSSAVEECASRCDKVLACEAFDVIPTAGRCWFGACQ
jgi:hypothetical protein